MQCPGCGGVVDVDFTDEFDPDLPFELVCYECGWFDPQRYGSREEAELVIESV
jgi:hypothetical protein